MTFFTYVRVRAKQSSSLNLLPNLVFEGKSCERPKSASSLILLTKTLKKYGNSSTTCAIDKYLFLVNLFLISKTKVFAPVGRSYDFFSRKIANKIDEIKVLAPFGRSHAIFTENLVNLVHFKWHRHASMISINMPPESAWFRFFSTQYG